MKKKIIKFEFIKKTIIYKFIKLIYYKIHNLKFIKKYHTTTGTYYLPIFAFKDIIRNKIMKNEIYQEEIVNLAKYFIALGDEMKDVPHALKSARAAIAYGLQMNKLPLLAENSHLYPLTWRVIDVKQPFILMFLNNKY